MSAEYRRKAKARRIDIDVNAVDWDKKLVDAGIRIDYSEIPKAVYNPLLLPAFCRYKKEQRLYQGIKKPTELDKTTFDEANMRMAELREKAECQEDDGCEAYMAAFKLFAETGGNRLADETKPINDRIAMWLKRKEEGKSKIRKAIEVCVAIGTGGGTMNTVMNSNVTSNIGVNAGAGLVVGSLVGYGVLTAMDIAYESYVDWQLNRLTATKGGVYFETLSTFAVGLNQYFKDSVTVQREMGQIVRDMRRKREITEGDSSC